MLSPADVRTIELLPGPVTDHVNELENPFTDGLLTVPRNVAGVPTDPVRNLGVILPENSSFGTRRTAVVSERCAPDR